MTTSKYNVDVLLTCVVDHRAAHKRAQSAYAYCWMFPVWGIANALIAFAMNPAIGFLLIAVVALYVWKGTPADLLVLRECERIEGEWRNLVDKSTEISRECERQMREISAQLAQGGEVRLVVGDEPKPTLQ